MRFWIVCFVFLTALSLRANSDDLACKGGDGGIPLSDVSHLFTSNVKMLPTRGLVKDFIHWPQSQSLIYRNERNELHQFELATASNRYLTVSGNPLAQLLDPMERYVLTAKDNWLIDISHPQTSWWQYYTPVAPTKLLYWHRNNLYGAISTQYPGVQRVSVFRVADKTSFDTCDLPLAGGEPFSFVEGQKFPDVLLYRQENTNKGVRLVIYSLKFISGLLKKKCRLDVYKPYAQLLPGRVKQVFHFTEGVANAISIDHPTQNLLWDNGPQCVYYNLGGKEPMVVDSTKELITTWSSEDGIGVLYPNDGKKLQLLKGFTGNPVSSKDLWLSQDSKHLFVGSRPAQKSGRIILDIKFDQRH